LQKTPTVRNRSKHKETNRPKQLPASLLMVPLILLPIKQCAWCNDSTSYGKFKSTTGKIGNVPWSFQKMSSQFIADFSKDLGPNAVANII
jgi:hypothetical protein